MSGVRRRVRRLRRRASHPAAFQSRQRLAVLAMAVGLLLVVAVLVWTALDRRGARQAEPGGVVGAPAPSAQGRSSHRSGSGDHHPAKAGGGPSARPGPAAGSDGRAHRVQLSATSTRPMVTLAWWVPTADGRKRFARHPYKRTTYTRTLTAYGKPKYATLYVMAGPWDSPITCTVRVDGKVTARESTKGPWDQATCEG